MLLRPDNLHVTDSVGARWLTIVNIWVYSGEMWGIVEKSGRSFGNV